MPLELAHVGTSTDVMECEYDWKTLALYALGIGATEQELDYLYEQRGPQVYPTFAVVPNYPVLSALLDLVGAPYEKLLHTAQTVEALAPIPPSGVMKTRGTVKALYDMKRMSQLLFTTTTSVQGVPVFEMEWEMLLRDEGGFGGPRRPKAKPPVVPDRDADWSHTEKIPRTQALLYRLSGDFNPLHADPAFAQRFGFERGPILHGLCSFGYVCRAVSINSCGGDARRIKRLTAQFKRPVWPGDSITSHGYVDGNVVLLEAYSGSPDNVVISGCSAELGDPLVSR